MCEGLVIAELNGDGRATLRKMRCLGVRMQCLGVRQTLGLLLVRLLRTLNSAFEKGNAVYMWWKGAGSRPPFLEGCGLAITPPFCLQGSALPLPLYALLGIIPLGMFSLSVESQCHHDISACGP